MPWRRISNRDIFGKRLWPPLYVVDGGLDHLGSPTDYQLSRRERTQSCGGMVHATGKQGDMTEGAHEVQERRTHLCTCFTV